jgi:hypothetical protein
MAGHIGEAKAKRKRSRSGGLRRQDRREASPDPTIAVVILSYVPIKARSGLDPGGRLKFPIALAAANVF